MEKLRRFETVVLGGGPTGIAAGAILGLPVITESIQIPFGPVYFHYTPETKRFVDEILPDNQIEVKTIRIGIVHRGKLYDSSEAPEEAFIDYSKKTGKPRTYKPQLFEYLDVNWFELLTTAATKAKTTYFSKIIAINLEKRQLVNSSGGFYEYDHLISTIPFYIFERIIHDPYILMVEDQLKSMKVRISDVDHWERTDFNNFDYVYFADVDDSRIRWSHQKSRHQLVGRQFVERFTFPGEDFNMMRILDGKVKPPKHVTFAGRFARWEEERYIHDDIKDFYSQRYVEDVADNGVTG